MSVTSARAAIKAALSTVSGVAGFERQPGTVKAGAAWVLLDNLERGPGLNFAGTWRVMLALGGDEKTAMAKSDQWLPLVVEAVETQGAGYVYQATPGVLKTDAGDVFALQIFVRSE